MKTRQTHVTMPIINDTADVFVSDDASMPMLKKQTRYKIDVKYIIPILIHSSLPNWIIGESNKIIKPMRKLIVREMIRRTMPPQNLPNRIAERVTGLINSILAFQLRFHLR